MSATISKFGFDIAVDDANHLGDKVRIVSDNRTYAYSPVDLAKFTNMSYYDPIAGDGQGIWTGRS